MAWLSPQSPNVGTFTVASQPMSPRSHILSAGLTFRQPVGRSEDNLKIAQIQQEAARTGASDDTALSLPALKVRGISRKTDEAGGMGEVFSTLRTQPYGKWLLAFVAVGLIAFGLYSLLAAIYRRINPKM